MANTSDRNTGVGRHIAAACIVVATVVLLAVLRMTSVAPGWLIGAVVVFNVLVVLAILMHAVGEGGPVRNLTAFTLFLLVALTFLTTYTETGGYEGETFEGFVSTSLDESDMPHDDLHED